MTNRQANIIKLLIGGLIITMFMMLALPSFADERRGRNGNDVGATTVDVDSRPSLTSGDVTLTGGDTTLTGGDNTASNTTNVSISEAEIPTHTTSDIRLENTPDSVQIVPGSGDSCKAHIGANLSVPGLGTGLTIPLPGKECRKLKYYDRMVVEHQWQTAEIIFCSLKEVRREFAELELNCRDTLTIHITPLPTPEPTGMVVISEEEYEQLSMAQVSKEVYDDHQEAVEYRYEQQQVLIEALEEEHASDDVKIAALKGVVDAALKERDAKEAEEEASRERFKAILAAKEAKEQDNES